MKKISILDCTLRDGGYVNNWEFGRLVISQVVKKLIVADVEIVELGYLSTKESGNPDVARYSNIQDVRRAYSSCKKKNQDYAVMINLGEYPVELLQPADENSPILRVAFHKKDLELAFEYFENLQKLGYRYYIQPMGVLNYSDEEFIQLINKANSTLAEAFYIVDSFGVIEMKDFRRLIFVADSNLNQRTALGYHAHNNLQQAYSNAKYMVEQNLEHDLIIDASVFGMGRGAGNLNVELFATYLNQNYQKNYSIDSILEVFDECLKPIFARQFWGYSMPFYLSSIHNCHPNYASYFAEKNTLSVKSMHELLGMISESDKNSFTKEKAAAYYIKYQENFIDDSAVMDSLSHKLVGKKLLILAPGGSLVSCQREIDAFIKDNSPIVLGVNNVSDHYEYEYLFISNEKRMENCLKANVSNYIISSNIRKSVDNSIKINYASYLCDNEFVSDNATLMLLNVLVALGVRDVSIAGFDGFSPEPNENYFEKTLSMGSSVETKMIRNSETAKELKRLKDKIEIQFVTPSLYTRFM